MQSVRLTVTVEPEQAAALARIAQQTGMSMSALHRYALAEFLRRPVILPAMPHETRQIAGLAKAEADA